MFRRLIIFFFLVFAITSHAQDSTLRLKKVIRGGLSPKSVVHSGTGLFFAQNMMYSHTVRVYNRDYELVKVISDKVKPKEFGIDSINGFLSGSPVEAAFSHNGKYAWVSNYNMSGEKFTNPGCDGCHSDSFDVSFLYKINTEDYKIEEIIKVGSVPKYVAVSPDNKYVLVSNWSSGDVSIVDIEKSREIKRIKAGRFPRGIVVDSKSRNAYVTIMGSLHILKIDLKDFSTSWIKNVGSGPRHLCISSDDSLLYVSLNNEGKIAKINLFDLTIKKLSCAGSPRSMVITPDDRYMYVVNYSIDKMSKIDLKTFTVVEQQETKASPIGITYDATNNEVWVACYSGALMVFRETFYPSGPQWYDVFNVQDHLVSMFDYVGKMSDSFFASADTKNELKTNNELKGEKKSNSKKTINVPLDKKEVANENEIASNKITKSKNTTANIKDSKVNSVSAVKTNSKIEKVEMNNAEQKLVAGHMYVIVGSFKKEDNALKLVSSLRQKGYSANAIKRGNGMTYAAVGDFTNEESANDTLQKIKSNEGMDAWIFKM